MIPFREELRYIYPLNENSIVLDVGGHKGVFTREINNRYHCRIETFEPVVEYYLLLREEFKNHDNIIIHPYGLAAETSQATFGIKGDMTGKFAEGDAQIVQCLGIRHIMDRIGKVDLLKLNAEGMEFEIMEWMLNSGRVREIVHYQIQFHPVVPDADRRQTSIRTRLSNTHTPSYDDPWVWCSYSLKT